MNRKDVFDNVKYMMKNWIKWDKRSLWYLAIRVPAMVFLPLLTAYVPKAMIDCIQKQVSVGELVLTVSFLSLTIACTTWLNPFMQEKINGSARITRMRYAMQSFRKTMYTDFINVESIEGREKQERAHEFYRSHYSSSAAFYDTVCQLAVAVLGITASMALLYQINFLMILVIAATCVGEFFLLKLMNRHERALYDEQSKQRVIINYFYELSRDFAAGKDIRLYGFADYFKKYAADAVITIDRLIKGFTHKNIKTSAVRGTLNLLRELVAYGYLIYLVLADRITVSEFIFSFGIITGFSNWVISLVSLYSALERCASHCQKYRAYLELDDNRATGEKTDMPVDSIEFRNVSFTYPGADASTIKNMSFKINKGENIAVVGENGAGKTTAVKLLCGLYRPTEGDVLINGKSTRDMPSEEYYSLFAPVFQDYNFLPMSIAKNITLTDNYDEEKLRDVLEKSGISQKIATLPNGVQTMMIKEIYRDAADFSGGEKQKLLLARALYKDAPVLILDEPTAALDPVAENELYMKYDELTGNKISFFISHRLSSTRFCDRIIYVKDGKITEDGTHEELMAKQGSYYSMYMLQSYYYKEQEGLI